MTIDVHLDVTAPKGGLMWNDPALGFAVGALHQGAHLPRTTCVTCVPYDPLLHDAPQPDVEVVPEETPEARHVVDRDPLLPDEQVAEARPMPTLGRRAPGTLTGYNPSSDDIRDVFDSLPPKAWDVSVWRADGNHEEGRIDKADALRLINAILGVPR